MPDVQSTEPADDTVAEFPPVPAARVTHPTHMPTVRRHEGWPFERWRLVMVGAAILVGVFCGPEAAKPIANGADLGVLVSLAAFVLAFILPTPRKKG